MSVNKLENIIYLVLKFYCAVVAYGAGGAGSPDTLRAASRHLLSHRGVYPCNWMRNTTWIFRGRDGAREISKFMQIARVQLHTRATPFYSHYARTRRKTIGKTSSARRARSFEISIPAVKRGPLNYAAAIWLEQLEANAFTTYSFPPPLPPLIRGAYASVFVNGTLLFASLAPTSLGCIMK